MATSLISTGVQFADSTIQTTAAVAGGGSIEAVASGSLSNGSKVVINVDGTVSVVSATGNPQAVGSPVVFESANSTFNSATYDSTNNKVVVAYVDGGNSSYGTAIVGTVSGTSISFGTAVVFNSASTGQISATYNSTGSKVVISYRNGGNSSFGTAIVGTVSGTSISFGAAAAFNSTFTSSTSATYDSTNNKVVITYTDGSIGENTAYVIVGTVSGTSISFGTAVLVDFEQPTAVTITYDSTNNRVVISYVDQANSSYGTVRVGTVSGTSISLGSPVIFSSASTATPFVTYDSTNSKVVIAYTNNANSQFGTAIVGTVSGTSISFGTAVVFESAVTSNTRPIYDSTNNKIVTAYTDVGNSAFGTLIVGTVSGTSISFGSATVFESATTANISATYNSVDDKVVIAYQDQGNSSFGTSVVFANASTNLTAENYIGISDAAYTNGQTATIQLAGAVDDAQTSLTAGQSYFVQTDGTLGLTPDTPSVFAGTAVSSTKLIIKG